MRLFLIRHGEAASNVERRFLGTSDEPLTERGRRQAESLGELLAATPPETLVSSPLRRAVETAEAIGRRIGLEVVLEERIAERSFGEWEGLTALEAAEGTDEPEAGVTFAEAARIGPPGGEGWRSLESRVLDAVAELEGRSPVGPIAFVSHVGPIKVLLARTLDISPEQTASLILDPGTVTVVDWGERPRLRCFNFHGHLGWPGARWLREEGP